jgi:hypothetical protein
VEVLAWFAVLCRQLVLPKSCSLMWVSVCVCVCVCVLSRMCISIYRGTRLL